MSEGGADGAKRDIAPADLLQLLGLSHRPMRALRDQDVKLRNFLLCQDFRREWKEKIGVVVARLIGNDGEHALPQLNAVEGFGNDDAQFFRRKRPRGRAAPDYR